ncbi:uncharacterized protein [Ptychodera flava]|uniref:uncharacterized protein n=1 Tax=Ptychodera flava TaxID=63121 RepID=UPI00396A0E44
MAVLGSPNKHDHDDLSKCMICDDDEEEEEDGGGLNQYPQTTAKPNKKYIRLRKNLVMVKTAFDFPWGEEMNISEENSTVRSSSSSSNSNCCSNNYSSHSSDSHSSHDSDSDNTDCHYSDSSSSQSEDIYSCNSDHSQFTENGDNIVTQDFNVKLKDLLHSHISHSPSNIQDTQHSSNSSVPMNTQEFNTKWQALSNNHQPSTQSSSPSSHPTRQIGSGSIDDLSSKDSPSDEDSGAKYYSIVRVHERQVKKFNATAHDYEIQFNDIQPVRGFVQVMVVLQDVFESIIGRLTHGISPRDRVRITLESPSLPYQIWLPFSPVQELTVYRVLGEIERVLQSYEEFTLDDSVHINFIHVHMPVGTGKKWGRRPVNIARRLRLMRSVIRITNTDELCCARAIVTATAHINRNNDPGWDYVRMGRQEQKRRASELITKAGISPGPCGHEELDKLQAVLPSYRIHVISDETSGSLAYQGRDTAEHNIYLYHHNNHYDVITSMPAFLQRHYYCHHCHTGYQNNMTTSVKLSASVAVFHLYVHRQIIRSTAKIVIATFEVNNASTTIKHLVPSLNMQHVKSFVAASCVVLPSIGKSERKMMTITVVKNTVEYVNSTKTVTIYATSSPSVLKERRSPLEIVFMTMMLTYSTLKLKKEKKKAVKKR